MHTQAEAVAQSIHNMNDSKSFGSQNCKWSSKDFLSCTTHDASCLYLECGLHETIENAKCVFSHCLTSSTVANQSLRWSFLLWPLTNWVDRWGRVKLSQGRTRWSAAPPFFVSGWQGFCSTPSHPSNEVIKWKNEAWKKTCCWVHYVPEMPLPTMQPLDFKDFAVEDRKKKLTQGWGNFCNMPATHLSDLGGMHAGCLWYELVMMGLLEEEEGSLRFVKIISVFLCLQYCSSKTNLVKLLHRAQNTRMLVLWKSIVHQLYSRVHTKQEMSFCFVCK